MTASTATANPTRGLTFGRWAAKWYATSTKRGLPEFRALAARIASELPAGSDVLEVAPGPGFLSIEMARTRRLRVAAVEISQPFVEMGRASAAEQNVEVTFRQGNAAAIPFEDASFDFIVCRAAFKKFSEPVTALQEMYRVLRPGGRAMIIDLRREAPLSQVDNYVAEMHLGPLDAFMTRRMFRHLVRTAYTEPQLRGFIAQTKFERSDIGAGGIGFEVHLYKARA